VQAWLHRTALVPTPHRPVETRHFLPPPHRKGLSLSSALGSISISPGPPRLAAFAARRRGGVNGGSPRRMFVCAGRQKRGGVEGHVSEVMRADANGVVRKDGNMTTVVSSAIQ